MRLRNPALEFGPPTSFGSALGRLPTSNHPDLSWNNDLGHIYSLRRVLALAESGIADDLYERMVPLTDADIALLERWSFKRADQPLFRSAGTSFIPPGSYWSQVYAQDNDHYGHWKIHQMQPQYPQLLLPKFELLCIQYKEDGGQPDEFPYIVGPVRPVELAVLLHDLRRGYPS